MKIVAFRMYAKCCLYSSTTNRTSFERNYAEFYQMLRNIFAIKTFEVPHNVYCELWP